MKDEFGVLVLFGVSNIHYEFPNCHKSADYCMQILKINIICKGIPERTSFGEHVE